MLFVAQADEEVTLAAELRIAFLVFLFLTGFLLLIRTKGEILGGLNIFQVLMDFFIVLTISGTVLTFAFLLFRIDPLPLIRNLAYRLSFQHLVSFESAIPENLDNSLAASAIMRQDTDGDNFDEWVVFYKFDLKAKSSPVKAVIYDNDRGNPPVIFPYNLRVPGRDYLAEDGGLSGQPTFELVEVTQDQNGPNLTDLPEILIESTRELAIFRYRNNSEIWDFPRDAPPRYEAIGFFRGSGGVEFDEQSKRVTVFDRDGFERSQLVVRSLYGINETNTYWDAESYWDNLHGGRQRDLEAELAAPVISTIDFFPAPPNEITKTAFPEKIVLAFYASTCSSQNATLCRNADQEWTPQSFLAPNSEAMAEFRNGNPGYFGLPGGFGSTSQVSVSRLCYYPRLETDPDLRETGQGRDVVTGEEPRFNLVDIEFVINSLPAESARYEMTQVDGQWRMVRRVPIDTTVVCQDVLASLTPPTPTPPPAPPPLPQATGNGEEFAPPAADAGGPYTAMLGKPPQAVVTFDGSGSIAPIDRTIVNYEWDFGDGSPPAAGQIVTHTYTSLGRYVAVLTVTDDRGVTAQDTAEVMIVGPTPPAVN